MAEGSMNAEAANGCASQGWARHHPVWVLGRQVWEREGLNGIPAGV